MTLSKIYVGSSAAFAAATFLLIAVVNPTLPSVRRCLNQQAEHGGIAAISFMPSVLAYSAFKGFLWPLSLVNAVAIHDMPFGAWLLNRYDPFNGTC